MSWLHCSIKDGSIIALSEGGIDDDLRLSDVMQANFIHLYRPESVEELKYLTDPVRNPRGQITSKFNGKVNLNSIFSPSELARVSDRQVVVKQGKRTLQNSSFTSQKNKAAIEADHLLGDQ